MKIIPKKLDNVSKKVVILSNKFGTYSKLKFEITDKDTIQIKKNKKKMNLKPEVIELIRKRKDLREQLQSEMNLSYDMLMRYLRHNPPRSPLKSIEAGRIISTNLHKPINELYQ